MTKLKNLDCDKTKKVGLLQNKNSNCEKTWFYDKTFKKTFSKNNLTPWQPMTCTLSSALQSGDVFSIALIPKSFASPAEGGGWIGEHTNSSTWMEYEGQGSVQSGNDKSVLDHPDLQQCPPVWIMMKERKNRGHLKKQQINASWVGLKENLLRCHWAKIVCWRKSQKLLFLPNL